MQGEKLGPGYLTNPDVLQWLEGVVPAWDMLVFESYCRLAAAPGTPECAMTFSDDFRSPLAVNGMAFLEALAAGEKLTASGNLNRAFVRRMMDGLEWPAFDREMHDAVHKVTNEPDFVPIHALRIFCQQAGLFRRSGGTLGLSKTGRTLVASGNAGRLQRILFEAAFWNTNLAYFDGYALQGWPRSSIGLALWCLSVLPEEPEDVHRLARLCTIPVNGILSGRRDAAGNMFEARVLRPLHWFGLVRQELRPHPDFEAIKQRWYSPLASLRQFVQFDVQVEVAGSMH